LSEFAKFLLPHVKNAKFNVEYLNKMSLNYYGLFKSEWSPNSGPINQSLSINNWWVESRPNDLNHVLLHEITHYVTYNALKSNKDLNNNIQKVIDSISSKITNDDKLKFGLALSNPSEFLSEFWSNSEFQDLLKSISVKNETGIKNMFEKVLNVILSWLNPPTNAYELLLPVFKNIVEYSTGMQFETTKHDGNILQQYLNDQETNVNWSRYADNGYEVSSQGDNRFSALNATFKEGTMIEGVDVGGRTIEDVYQSVIKKSGKGQAPSKDSKLYNPSLTTKEQQEDYSYSEGYLPLWQEWARQNPSLIEELREKSNGKTLTDKFASTRVSQARALAEILNNTKKQRPSEKC
jgi:hypothetical protein